MLLILLKIVLLFFLADFTTGIYHFLVDTYGVLNGKYLVKSINPLLHDHINPNYITQQIYWQINGGMYRFSILIFTVSLFFGFYWELLLFILFCSNGNMIHKWAHQNSSEIPKIIKKLQWLTIIQTQAHHLKHHSNQFHENYCMMSNYLNPLLHSIYFWELIKFLFKICGLSPVERKKQILK